MRACMCCVVCSPQPERKQITDAKTCLGVLEHKMHHGQVSPSTVARLQELTTGMVLAGLGWVSWLVCGSLACLPTMVGA